MNGLVILEGPDGSGKSLLALKLKETFNATIIHHGPYPGQTHIAPHYAESIYRALRKEQLVVMDRSWLSEPVYAQAMKRGAPRVSQAQASMLDRLALTVKAVVIYCLPPLKTVIANHKRKTEDMVKGSAVLTQVYHTYKEQYRLGSATCLDRVTHDYVNFDTGKLISEIGARFLKSNPANGRPGIGGWWPETSILLVGDRPSVRGARTRLNLPFINLRSRQGCSSWLAEELWTGGIPERILYWVNAHSDYDGEVVTDGAFLRELKPALTVALGEESYRWCWHQVDDERLDPKNLYRVRHPMHWKRFRHTEQYELIALIKEKTS